MELEEFHTFTIIYPIYQHPTQKRSPKWRGYIIYKIYILNKKSSIIQFKSAGKSRSKFMYILLRLLLYNNNQLAGACLSLHEQPTPKQHLTPKPTLGLLGDDRASEKPSHGRAQTATVHTSGCVVERRKAFTSRIFLLERGAKWQTKRTLYCRGLCGFEFSPCFEFS